MNLVFPIGWNAAFKTWEIAIAAPQVIALRTALMASTLPIPSKTTSDEMIRMGSEKIAAFHESATAVNMMLVKTQQSLVSNSALFWCDSVNNTPYSWATSRSFFFDAQALIFRNVFLPEL